MTKIETPPTDDEIGALARKYWIDEGRPEGKAEEHWQRAEEELLGKTQPQSQDKPQGK